MKKQIFHLSSLALFVLLLSFAWSCKKESSEPAKTAPTGVTTSAATNISQTGATIAGTVGANGGSALTSRGVVYSKTNTTPTTDADDAELASGTDVGSFSVTLSGLDAKTKYYARAFATNSVGITYGSAINFTTDSMVANQPVVTSNATVSSITQTNASFGGNVTSDGGSPVTARGVCWNTSGGPTVSLSTKTTNGSGTGSFSSSITGLTAGTIYKVRAYATNANGTAYGEEVTFTTLAAVSVPVVSSNSSVSSITQTSAGFGGSVTSDGGSPVTERGVCWNTTGSPTVGLSTKTTDGSGIGSFNSSITGLTAGTTYKVRAYATNANGTAYGAEVTFTTATLFTPGGGVTDKDGNTYQTIIIGTQEWMKENLKVSKYRDGSEIATGLNNFDWSTTTEGAFAIYEDLASNNTTFGKLYNWYALVDTRGLCPTGWHVPSDAEWTTLENYLGGVSVAGGKMKAVSSLWASPNAGATNECGFSGLPAGIRTTSGSYSALGNQCNFWSTTEATSGDAWSRKLTAENGYSYKYSYFRQPGFSVRCIKN